jgi:hypothetical protein
VWPTGVEALEMAQSVPLVCLYMLIHIGSNVCFTPSIVVGSISLVLQLVGAKVFPRGDLGGM